MSVATAETDVAVRRPESARAIQRLFKPSGPTLEDTILGAWEGLAATGSTPCPVCKTDELEPGGCARCGSVLS